MALEHDESATAARHEARQYPWRTMLIVMLVLTGIVFAASWLAGRGGVRSRGRPAAAVSVARAARADMPVTTTALGTVQPVITATVRAQLSGVLFKLFFRDGQMVKQGQLLAQIDPRPYQLALAQAKANLARDQAQLAAAQVDLDRYQTLLKQDSIASQQVDTQRATVRQLTGTIAADRAAIGSAELNLGYTAIRAPATGRIGIREVDIGNYLTPSDTNGIAVITQLDPIDISFSLPQSQLPAIARAAGGGAGLPVEARDQSDNRTIATGHFLTFDNQVDTATGTVKAKARFDNGGNALFPNEFVNISMLIDTLKGVVTVPVSAVRHGAPGDFVFVLRPDRTVKLAKVTTGASDGTRIAILSGLTADAPVVTEGADGLEDGAAVRLPGDKSDAAVGGGRHGGGRHGGHHGRRHGADGGQGE